MSGEGWDNLSGGSVCKGWLWPVVFCALEREMHKAQQAAVGLGIRKKRGALPPCWVSVGLLALVSYTCLICAVWEEFYFLSSRCHR